MTRSTRRKASDPRFITELELFKKRYGRFLDFPLGPREYRFEMGLDIEDYRDLEGVELRLRSILTVLKAEQSEIDELQCQCGGAEIQGPILLLDDTIRKLWEFRERFKDVPVFQRGNRLLVLLVLLPLFIKAK